MSSQGRGILRFYRTRNQRPSRLLFVPVLIALLVLAIAVPPPVAVADFVPGGTALSALAMPDEEEDVPAIGAGASPGSAAAGGSGSAGGPAGRAPNGARPAAALTQFNAASL